MQLSRGSLRPTLRALDLRFSRVVVYGIPGARLQHERHHYSVCHYETGRVATVQLRTADGWPLGFRRIGIDKRPSGLLVRRC